MGPVDIQATAVSNCGQFGSYGECFYNIECKWCANGNNPWDPQAADFNWTAGACIDYATETPVGMNCPPPKTGCAAHVEQDDCNDDSSCKWCQAWTQGWPSCEDVRFTEKMLQSTCDKPDASGEGEGEGLSGTCGRNRDFWACGLDITCQWCGPDTMWNSSAADFDPEAGACITVGKDVPFPGLNCPPPSDKLDRVETQATAVGNCGQFESYYTCMYSIECKWCANSNNPWDPEAADFNWTAGACIDYATETPVGMNCPPPKTGCAAHVEQGDCNDDSSCKWCQAWTQGWPSCEDVKFTEKELQSTCDKPDASGEGEGEGLSDTCGQNRDFWACGLDITCQWCGPDTMWNSSAADFDPE